MAESYGLAFLGTDGKVPVANLPPGSQGPPGPEGPQGVAGPPGAQGAAGADGEDGATGATGPAGQNGAAGAQGQQGIQGIQGPAGANGTSPTLASVFPVGSVVTLTVATNPATLYGFGTWAAFAAGRCLIGDGGGFSAGQTGGAATHTLTTPEIPSHNHVQDAHTHTQNAHTHAAQIQGNTTGTTTGTNVMGSAATGGSARNAAIQPANATAVNQNATATNQATGGGLAHNNMQPYLVVYFWTRTA